MSENAVKTAVVTGASSAFGAAYARGLAERGYRLVLVGRDEAGLSKQAAAITGKTGASAEVLVADLTDATQLAEIERRLATDESIEMLVNSAGLAGFAPVAGLDPASLDKQIALNITATTRLTAAVLPALKARGHGTIVNFASALVFYILPVSAVYSGTKSYVLTFTQALQQEVDGSGVTAQLVIPGAMRTGFWAGSGVDLSAFPDEAIMEPEEAAAAALAGLDAGEPVTIPSLPDIADWQAFEQAGATLAGGASRAVPAARYLERAGRRS
jgi:uncharacterized protein